MYLCVCVCLCVSAHDRSCLVCVCLSVSLSGRLTARVPAGPAMPPLSSREGGAAQSRRADPAHRSMPRSVWPSVPPDGQAGRPCRGRTPSCFPRSFHASKCCGRAAQPRREPRRRYCESPAAGRMWNSGPVESTPGGTRAGPFASKLAKARHVRGALEMSRRTQRSRAWRRALTRYSRMGQSRGHFVLHRRRTDHEFAIEFAATCEAFCRLPRSGRAQANLFRMLARILGMQADRQQGSYSDRVLFA